MSRIRYILAGVSVSTVVALSALAFADDDHPHHRGPPPEAFTACDGKADGDACSVTFHDNTAHAGTCEAPHHESDGKRLACRPNDLPPPPDR
jgi:hypothetical protein